MNGVFSEQELREAVISQTYIKNGNPENCEGMKYDFRLSNRVLRADFNRPLEFADSSTNEQEKLVIEPGEVAFVMTEEDLDLPNNVFCQLSSKRKLSHGGIIVLGGFTVDPNYRGKLIFGLYNISSRKYPIIPGKKLVAGIFYKLDESEISQTNVIPEALYDFPDDLLAMIKEYKPINNSDALNSFNATMEALREEVKAIKSQIDSDKAWKDDFKKGLDENNEQINKIGNVVTEIANKLSQEIDERKTESADLKTRIKGASIFLAVLIAIGGGIFTLIVTYLAGILQF